MNNLPKLYDRLTWQEHRAVREEYITLQEGKCYYCKSSLDWSAPKHIRDKEIDWTLFPENFLKYPVHLQHDHDSGLTEGAVHAYCNAVMWYYEAK